MPFIVGKATINAAGEPLWRAAKRLRLEIEAEMVARADLAEDPDGLQIVGLLLQLEGLARRSRCELIPDSDPRAHGIAPGRDLARRG